MDKIILFDGECNFCNWNVQFIIKHDPKAKFKFASLQSDIGQQFVDQFQISKNENSLVLIENERFYLRSTAALKICRNLTFWRIFYIFILLPKRMRDAIYHIIARNRYKWFGKRDACMIPSQEIQNRFLS